jgi:hypothetical protein
MKEDSSVLSLCTLHPIAPPLPPPPYKKQISCNIKETFFVENNIIFGGYLIQNTLGTFVFTNKYRTVPQIWDGI